MNKNIINIAKAQNNIKIKFNGNFIANSSNAIILNETGHSAVYYFPLIDTAQEYFFKNNHSTFCPFKGKANYWNIQVNDKSIQNAAWSYKDPIPEQLAIKNLIAFYWEKMDTWYKDDEEIFL